MVKVALFISGQPRFVDSISYKYIKKKILDRYSCDVYCHTWYKTDFAMKTAPWSGLKDFSCKGNEIDLIKNQYNPKCFTYDTPIEDNLDYSIYNNPNNSKIEIYNLHSMYRSIQLCYENYSRLNSNNPPIYDIYVRLRFDVIPKNLPDFECLSRDSLYYINHHGTRDAIANNIVISTSHEYFKNIMNAYDYIPIFGKKGYRINDEHNTYNLVNELNMQYSLLDRDRFDDLLPQQINFNMYDFNFNC